MKRWDRIVLKKQRALLLQYIALVMFREYHNILVLAGTGLHGAKQTHVNLA